MDIYKTRLNKYGTIQWTELPSVSKKKVKSPETLCRFESQAFMKEIQPQDFVVGLDEKGASLNSRDFAGEWNKITARNSKVVVLIGGAYGFHKELYSRMNRMISLSQMTFSHQLVRLLFLEQLYRALTILKGEPYHND